jgi:hypothetical protein
VAQQGSHVRAPYVCRHQRLLTLTGVAVPDAGVASRRSAHADSLGPAAVQLAARSRFIADATHPAKWRRWIEVWWAATLTYESLHELRVVGDIEELAGAQSVRQRVVQLAQVIEHLHAERFTIYVSGPGECGLL